ncbi:hypothetical protein [Silvimonas amylolytica]|nr:hypothetical protein [Silvimonas amylolytica]
MKTIKSGAQALCVVSLMSLLSACGGGGGTETDAPASGYKVGGVASGLPDGEPVVLQNSNGDTTTVSANGSFSFPATVGKGAAYAVMITRQPLWASCSVSQQNGTANADVSSIQLNCVAAKAQVTTVAGPGAFQNAQGLVLAADGSFYVSDFTSDIIYSVNSIGQVQPWAGGFQTWVPGSSGYPALVTEGWLDGPRLNSQFFAPVGLALDKQGNMYVADRGNSMIRKISASGAVSTLAGDGSYSFQDGQGAHASFDQPQGVAVDDAGNVYVADTRNLRIRKITPDGTVSTLAGSGTAVSQDGTGAAASFTYPRTLAMGPDGNLYVGELNVGRLRKVTPAGAVTTIAGRDLPGFADGTGPDAAFNGVTGVVVDQNGTIYVSDFSNNAIRRISRNGVVTTLAGSGQSAVIDGIGSAAAFQGPEQLTLDAQGNLYVVEIQSGAIRRISPTQ